MSILSSAKGFAGRALLFAKDKSPELCFVGGVIALIGAGYCLWNGKDKCRKILDDHKDSMAEIKEDETAEKCTPKQAKSRRFRTNMKTAVAFAKVFVPIALLSVGSVTLFGKSTAIYKGRYLASAAVIAEQNKQISALQGVLEGNLPEGKTIQDVLQEAGLDLGGPVYELWFDERSREFILGDYDANRDTLLRMIRVLTDKLHGEWAIYLNQIIKYMDLHTGNEHGTIGIDAGQIMGVSLSTNPEDGAVGEIDLGIDWEKTDFAEPILLRIRCDKTPLLGRIGMAKK